MRTFAFIAALSLAVISCLTAQPAKAYQSGLWQALSEGRVVAMIRHALAPGTGDPDNFSISDCSTQRNLDDVGREQAKIIGQHFRDQGLGDVKVYTSAWCRCRETADLMALGDVENLPALNSFFQRFERRDTQTRELRSFLKTRQGQPTVLVTHQVNITALTGVFPRSGEIIFFSMDDDETVTVLGRLETAMP